MRLTCAELNLHQFETYINSFIKCKVKSKVYALFSQIKLVEKVYF